MRRSGWGSSKAAAAADNQRPWDVGRARPVQAGPSLIVVPSRHAGPLKAERDRANGPVS